MANDRDILEKAIKEAMAQNSKSSIMFLLRERLVREIAETVASIILPPYIKRIQELEMKLRKLEEHSDTPKSRNRRSIDNAIDNLRNLTDEADDL